MNEETSPRRTISPLMALIISAVVLPGMGQILTGRIGKGLLMAGAVALWLPVAVIKVGRDLSSIMPELMEKTADGSKLVFGDVQAALSPMADSLVWLFVPLTIVWFWSFTDSLMYLAATRKRA